MANFKNYSDDELMSFFCAGRDAAFAELFDRYWDILLNAAFQRLKSRDEAEEVVQELFVNLYLRRKELVPNTSLKAYLMKALKYKVIDAYRTQQLHIKHLNSLMEQNSVSYPKPHDMLDIKELREKVWKVTEKLPEKCKQVFIMSRFDELSNQEIADRLTISVATVKSHLNRALKTMREEFGDRFELLVCCFFIFVG